ncbi:MAG: apolipoprotein N-acyltransferase [Maritimibacter sp.]|nr:apolipoprotein N-acyltransferase [Maritimibacter sp.]
MPADRGPGWARLPGWLEGRPARVIAGGFVIGLFTAFGQAPFNLWPATLAGLALAYALLGAAPSLRRAALTGWAFGLGYFGLTLIWIVQPFLVDLPATGWMAPFGWFFMAGGMALFWGAGFALARWLAPAGRFGWLAFAAAMGAMELIRAHLWTGFPWGGPGLSWIASPAAQLASLVGAYGLSVASFAGGALLARAVLARRTRPLVAFAAGLAVALGLGALAGRTTPDAPAETARLRLVQPNVPQALKWQSDLVWDFFQRTLDLTHAPAAGAPPDLVIWPETAVPTILGDYPELEAEIAAAAFPARAIVGIRRLDGTRAYNSMVLFAPDGGVERIYDKHHIVPFGEYIPLGDLAGRLGIHGLAAREGYGYSRGPGAAVLDLPGPLGTALPLICYEAIFPRDLRAAPARADWVLQITNDAWFGTFSGPQQHLVQARFRAIEFGLPVVRAANTGISAVIDARGRVLDALPLGTAGHLDADLPGARPATIYARVGDWPLAAIILAFLAIFIVFRRVKPVDPAAADR